MEGFILNKGLRRHLVLIVQLPLSQLLLGNGLLTELHSPFLLNESVTDKVSKCWLLYETDVIVFLAFKNYRNSEFNGT